MSASYAIPVRQASVLLTASFRFCLAADTLAVQLTIPLVGSVEDFHLQVIQDILNSASSALRAMPGAQNKNPDKFPYRDIIDWVGSPARI